MRTTRPEIWEYCSHLAEPRQPAHEMFVQNDVTGPVEVERETVILTENLHFSHCALFEGEPPPHDGRNPSWKPTHVPHGAALPVNRRGGVQMPCVVWESRKVLSWQKKIKKNVEVHREDKE